MKTSTFIRTFLSLIIFGGLTCACNTDNGEDKVARVELLIKEAICKQLIDPDSYTPMRYSDLTAIHRSDIIRDSLIKTYMELEFAAKDRKTRQQYSDMWIAVNLDSIRYHMTEDPIVEYEIYHSFKSCNKAGNMGIASAKLTLNTDLSRIKGVEWESRDVDYYRYCDYQRPVIDNVFDYRDYRDTYFRIDEKLQQLPE